MFRSKLTLWLAVLLWSLLAGWGLSPPLTGNAGEYPLRPELPEQIQAEHLHPPVIQEAVPPWHPASLSPDLSGWDRSQAAGVTVTPSPEAAAQVVRMNKEGESGQTGSGGPPKKQKKGNGGEPPQDNNGGNNGEPGQGWKDTLKNLLNNLYSSLENTFKNIANKIAKGHAFKKHVEQEQQFPNINNRSQFAQLIEKILRNPSDSKNLSKGRMAFWDNDTGTIVIVDPDNADGGTAFKPEKGKNYFDFLQ